MSPQDFQAMLRADALAIAMAVILVSAGFAAILLFSIRVLRKDYALLLFGFFSTFYGIRLFLSPAALQTRLTSQILLGISPSLVGHIVRDLTFVLPLIGFLFCLQILGDHVRRQWLIRLLLVYAPLLLATVGLTCDVFFPRVLRTLLNSLGLYSAAIVIVVASLLVNDFFRGGRRVNPEMRIFAGGFVIMGALVVHGNLTFFGVPGPNLEPLGFWDSLSSSGCWATW
jgi:hypothetical protein